MFIVDLLGYETAKLNTVRDEQEQPVEKHDAIRVPQTIMLEPLDGKNNTQGQDCKKVAPEAEIACPDIGVVEDLEDELNGDGCCDCDYEDLIICPVNFCPSLVCAMGKLLPYLLSPKMPISFHHKPLLRPHKPPHRNQSPQYPKRRHARNPHVHKTRREIIPVRTQRAPPFLVTA